MYVIIEAFGDKPVDPDDRNVMRRYGEPRVVSSHRTLRAAQKAWDKLDAKNPIWMEKSRHDFRGILTCDGLVNYYGDKLKLNPVGAVQVRMGVYSD